MSFDSSNRFQKIHESIRIPTPKVGVHLGVCGFIPSHPPTFLELWMWLMGYIFDSHLSMPLPKVMIIIFQVFYSNNANTLV
jgi:hypothetical protein